VAGEGAERSQQKRSGRKEREKQKSRPASRFGEKEGTQERRTASFKPGKRNRAVIRKLEEKNGYFPTPKHKEEN